MSEQSLVPSLNMEALLGKAETNPEPKTALELALSKVDPEDAAATSLEQVKFKFRDLIGEKDRAVLKENGPVLTSQMMSNYNAIINFGSPVLDKLNDSSVNMLRVQQDIKIPEAEHVVNDLLRSMDGYAAKYRNKQVEDLVDKVKSFFKGTGYSLVTMVRESKPIVDKLDMASEKLREMELRLADNVTRGQALHQQVVETLEQVVGVLAALEEVMEVAHAEFKILDDLVKEADQSNTPGDTLNVVTYKGEKVAVNQLRTVHAAYATGISELEKTWFDWRQQFFLGSAHAPAVLNLIMVSVTMQRRCQVFRTMGIPSARRSLVMWQQAQLAKEGAELGTAVQEGTNKLIQEAFGATAEAVAETAKASQAPVISEETVWAVINSVKSQCESLVAADTWGRAQRAQNLKALENGEQAMKTSSTEARRQLVANAVQGAKIEQELAPAPDVIILKQIGVEV